MPLHYANKCNSNNATGQEPYNSKNKTHIISSREINRISSIHFPNKFRSFQVRKAHVCFDHPHDMKAISLFQVWNLLGILSLSLSLWYILFLSFLLLFGQFEGEVFTLLETICNKSRQILSSFPFVLVTSTQRTQPSQFGMSALCEPIVTLDLKSLALQ